MAHGSQSFGSRGLFAASRVPSPRGWSMCFAVFRAVEVRLSLAAALVIGLVQPFSVQSLARLVALRSSWRDFSLSLRHSFSASYRRGVSFASYRWEYVSFGHFSAACLLYTCMLL